MWAHSIVSIVVFDNRQWPSLSGSASFHIMTLPPAEWACG